MCSHAYSWSAGQHTGRMVGLTLLLLLTLSHVACSPQNKVSTDASRAPKNERGKYAHWGPQHFLGWLPMRARRAQMDNHIPTMAAAPQYHDNEVSPEAEAVGESIMEEFIMFLTLKDAGLLDMCLQFK